MGLLKLLTFPVSGPIAGTHWLAETLRQQAERELYDEAAIREQMAALRTRRELGEISGEEFERQEELLLERLLEARAWHKRVQQ